MVSFVVTYFFRMGEGYRFVVGIVIIVGGEKGGFESVKLV